MMRNFFVVDDHSFTAEGIKAAFSAMPFECLGIAHNVDEAYKKISVSRPDCILIDHSINDKSGLDLLRLLKDQIPASRFILVSQIESKPVIRMYLDAGVKGIVSKLSGMKEIHAALSTPEQRTYLCPHILKIMETEDPTEVLTPREMEVSRFIALGKTNKEIAQSLSCSEFTIKSHKVSIMRKLKCTTSVEIGVWVLKHHGM